MCICRQWEGNAEQCSWEVYSLDKSRSYRAQVHSVQDNSAKEALPGLHTWRCCHGCLYCILQRTLGEVLRLISVRTSYNMFDIASNKPGEKVTDRELAAGAITLTYYSCGTR